MEFFAFQTRYGWWSLHRVDPYYLTHKAEEVGYNPQVILSGRRINDNMAKYAAKSVVKRLAQLNKNISMCKVGVLGVTFKENCPDIRNSKVFDLITELTSWNINVVVSNSLADPEQVLENYGVELTELRLLENLDALV